MLSRRKRTPPQGKLRGRGRSRETGTRSGWLAPAVGPPEPVLLGEPASLDRQVEQGPLHLIHGGGLVLLCPTGTPPPATDTPAN